MKKILVLVESYPNNEGDISLMFVHVRNLYYIKHNIDVTVLNFKAQYDYKIDNIDVITENTYNKANEKYDVVISHAANIKKHYRFLIKNNKKIKYMIFFFHGHEIVRINEVYPEPYYYMKKNNRLMIYIQNCYDKIKCLLWHRYYKRVAYKSQFIFVSKFLYDEFQKYIKLSYDNLYRHVHIINNSVGQIFEQNKYNIDNPKIYNFITIRNDMDSSIYCIDLICKLAERNPHFKFLIIGKGNFFKYVNRPENITWIDAFLNHQDMLSYIDKSKCALTLTRRDTQGVMSCELATYGIPLITSDLPVCKEIFRNVPNVFFMSNEYQLLIMKIQ